MRSAALGFLLALSLPFTAVAFAQTATGSSGEVHYIPLEPAFVTNYGGPGRLKYVKVDMTLMVDNLSASTAVQQHLPLIRNAVVLNLARQNENNVVTPTGQERIRQQVLQVLQETLQRETGQPVVNEVLFTNFIYQN